MKKLQWVYALLSSSFLLLNPLNAVDPAPYNFNVYASGNIGSQSSNYGSDFEGTTGVGGNAYFSGFSGNAVGPLYLYSVYTGGSFNMGSGSIRGGVESAGNVNINATSINGNVHGGANLQGGTGSINGNVSITGTNTSNVSINGGVSTNQPFTPSLNLPSITQYFQNASAYWAGLAPTATYTNVYGQLQVSNLVSGTNIVNLTLADLNAANTYGIKLTGPADANVVFNIKDMISNVVLKDVTFSLEGGMTKSNVLYNITNATSLNMQGGQYLNILAINSGVNFSSGLVTGNLIVRDLMGSGQVNLGQFNGFQADQNKFNIAVPEPSTYLLFGSFLGIAALVSRRKRISQL